MHIDSQCCCFKFLEYLNFLTFGSIVVLAPVSERLTAKSTTYDTITIYWPLPLENRKPPYFAKYKEKTADSFKRTLLPPNETEVNQGHVLNFLKSNTEYIIRLFAGNSRILNEVKIKTLAKRKYH